MSPRSVSRSARALAAGRSGVALVEFAICFPVLLVLFLGAYQIMDGVACKRKVSITDRAIADLTTQSKTVLASDLDTFLKASTQIMAPYSAAAAFVRVSQVYTDNTGKTTVSWSRAINGTSRAKDSNLTLPGTIKTNNSYLILSEITYSYNPNVASGIISPINLSDTLYMSPRHSNSVSCSDCS